MHTHTHTQPSSVLYSCIFTQFLQNTVDIVYCSSSLVTFVLCLSYILVNAPTTFLWPFGDNKGFYSILFSPSLCFFSTCIRVGHFLFPNGWCFFFFYLFLSCFTRGSALCVGSYNLRRCVACCCCHFFFFLLDCFALLCCETEKLSFFQSAALWKPCA